MKKNIGLISLLFVACLCTYLLNDRFLCADQYREPAAPHRSFFLNKYRGLLCNYRCWYRPLNRFGSVSNRHYIAVACCASRLVMAVGAALSLNPGGTSRCFSRHPYNEIKTPALYRNLVWAPTLSGSGARHYRRPNAGFGMQFESLRALATGKLSGLGLLPFEVPNVVFITLIVAIISSVVMSRTRYGLYLRAVGRNEVAARYSGVNTDRTKIWAYVACSLLAGFGGVLLS